MIQPNPNFRVVGVEDDEPAAPSKQENTVAIKMIQIALAALSQRAIAALASMFTILTVGGVFILFLSAPPDPSVKQITLLGIYAAFTLLINGLFFWSRK